MNNFRVIEPDIVINSRIGRASQFAGLFIGVG